MLQEYKELGCYGGEIDFKEKQWFANLTGGRRTCVSVDLLI